VNVIGRSSQEVAGWSKEIDNAAAAAGVPVGVDGGAVDGGAVDGTTTEGPAVDGVTAGGLTVAPAAGGVGSPELGDATGSSAATAAVGSSPIISDAAQAIEPSARKFINRSPSSTGARTGPATY
jgi:hypothetical protein